MAKILSALTQKIQDLGFPALDFPTGPAAGSEKTTVTVHSFLAGCFWFPQLQSHLAIPDAKFRTG